MSNLDADLRRLAGKLDWPSRYLIYTALLDQAGLDPDTPPATWDEVVAGVAYMVDFTPTDGGEPIINHQWVSQEELLPYELPADNG